MAFQNLLFAAMPEKLLLLSLATDLPMRDAELLNAAREDAAQTDKLGLLALHAAAGANFRPALREILQPALVLCGSKDWASLPAAKELAQGTLGAELRIVAGAGHGWNIERPVSWRLTFGWKTVALGTSARLSAGLVVAVGQSRQPPGKSQP
jgi:pimeloyl-ACP methyl ester carboxylesterase